MTSIALARVYQQSFETHPYTTLACTNGALNALGDIVAQFSQNLVRYLRAERLRSALTSALCRYSLTVAVTTTTTGHGTISLVLHVSLPLGSAWVSVFLPTRMCDLVSPPRLRTGPLIGRWNFFLERHFPLRAQSLRPGQPGKVSLKALGKRVAADQLFMYVASYLPFMMY